MVGWRDLPKKPSERNNNMSVAHTAQVYTEMLNDPKYRELITSESKTTFEGWDLSEKEKHLLISEAKVHSSKFNPANKVLNYIIRNQPLDQACGCALGNAIGRHIGLPVMGPHSAGCDAGCCSWTSRIVFAGDPALAR
jgi:hypothetical protein